MTGSTGFLAILLSLGASAGAQESGSKLEAEYAAVLKSDAVFAERFARYLEPPDSNAILRTYHALKHSDPVPTAQLLKQAFDVEFQPAELVPVIAKVQADWNRRLQPRLPSQDDTRNAFSRLYGDKYVKGGVAITFGGAPLEIDGGPGYDRSIPGPGAFTDEEPDAAASRSAGVGLLIEYKPKPWVGLQFTPAHYAAKGVQAPSGPAKLVQRGPFVLDEGERSRQETASVTTIGQVSVFSPLIKNTWEFYSGVGPVKLASTSEEFTQGYQGSLQPPVKGPAVAGDATVTRHIERWVPSVSAGVRATGGEPHGLAVGFMAEFRRFLNVAADSRVARWSAFGGFFIGGHASR